MLNSVFAGTAVITNFCVTIVTFPCAIILSDQNDFFSLIFQKMSKNFESFSIYLTQIIFDQIILKLVFNYRFPLIAILTLSAFCNVSMIFYYPGLQMPESQHFQVFNPDHIFESYDLKYSKNFWFARVNDRIKSASSADSEDLMSGYVLPIQVVFGVLPNDNGNSLDPFDRGSLEFDPKFDITTQNSQKWLLNFCRNIRTQSFYKPTMGPLLTNCFIEFFKSWMEDRQCEAFGEEKSNHTPCCQSSKFPYTPDVFTQCLVEMVERLHRTPKYMFNANRPGPRFSPNQTGIVKAVVIEYDSVFAYENSFSEMHSIWNQINGWVSDELQGAPVELKSGWFITSGMDFYGLQQSLSIGTTKSLVVSVVFAFITLIVVTWDVRLSVLSIITIAFIIFNTIGLLVLLQWKLNIIESIVISLTIGLAIDATLHYTIAYKLLAEVRLLSLNFAY